MRVHGRWNAKKEAKTLANVGTIVAANCWKASGELLLNLENEGFQIDTGKQRLDIIGESMCFLLHIVDRWTIDALKTEERQELLTSAAKRMAGMIRENGEGVGEPEGAEQRFIELVNIRMSTYAEFNMDEDEPGFAMKRSLGKHVQAVVGEKDRKWIDQQIMDVEVPEALRPMRRMLRMIMPNIFNDD